MRRKTLHKSESVGNENEGVSKGVREFKCLKSAINEHLSEFLGRRKHEAFVGSVDGGVRKF
jgi:hypothetical protein